MKTKFLEKMLTGNPNAKRDEKVLRDALDAVKSLRQMGFEPREFKLKSPFQRSGSPSPKFARYGVHSG